MRTEYKVTIMRIETGVKETRVFEKKYDSDHPKIISGEIDSQYDYMTVTKEVKDVTTMLEQIVNEIDLDRVIRAINKGI